MSKIKVYVSKSTDISEEYWQRVQKYLELNFPTWDVKTHKVGTPYTETHQRWVSICDIFIYLKNPDNNKCGKGCYEESHKTMTPHRYLLYLRSDAQFHFYDFNLQSKDNVSNWNNYADIVFGKNRSNYIFEKWSESEDAFDAVQKLELYEALSDPDTRIFDKLPPMSKEEVEVSKDEEFLLLLLQ